MALVDFAKSDEGKVRFAELATLDGFDHALLDDLDMLAHALLGVVESFDVAPRSPRAIVVPQELETQCRARAAATSPPCSPSGSRCCPRSRWPCARCA